MRHLVLVLALAGGCGGARTADDSPADDTGPGDDSGDDSPAADAAPPGADAPPGDPPLDLTDTALVIVVGDSIAAGYDATGRNGSGGHGYARLVLDGVRAHRPDADFRDLAESGATSADARSRVQGAMGSLPAQVTGDVLVLVNVGGNDFNDDIATMIMPSVAMQRAAALRTNLADLIGRLRERYDRPADGRHARFVVDTIHDPTDGLGTIPPEFDEGFCGTLQNPLLAPFREVALENLGVFNAAIAAEAAAQAATLLDVHALFLGHGMNGGAARWIGNDCAHPVDAGHAQMSYRVLM